MSHGGGDELPREEHSAPGDPIDLPAAAESTPQVLDFFADSFPGKPANLFSDSGAGDSVEETGVAVADLSVDSNKDENTGGEDEEESSGGLRGDYDEVAAAPAKVATATDRFDTNESEITESTMAETLMNGLRQMDHGGEIVLPTAEERNHQRNVVSNSDQQSVTTASEQSSDERADIVRSPWKRADNGRPVEHHRRPPITGSHGGGPLGGSFDSSADVNTPRAASGPGIVGDVLHSIATEEEEGRSRQRILAFAAKRYSTAVERSPQDHDALYNWALVLQESADNTGPEGGNTEKDRLLEEACRKYEAATELCPTLHEAFYNWAIAISDRAKIRGRTKEAEGLWKQACERYDKSVQLNWNSPQALNNWGLALQELGAIVPLKEKRAIVKKAIRKFRAAIRLRFDFHRAVYNLGTVLYGLAEDTLRGGRKLPGREAIQADLYSQSAIYIAAAHALKPDYPVYRSALRLVRSMRHWFVLDQEALYEMERLERRILTGSASRSSSGIGESSNSITQIRAPLLRIEMEDIVRMVPCADLSLPRGGGFRIDTLAGPQFLIADTWDGMDGWVDAIRLVYTIFARGKRDSLAGLLAG